MLNTRSNDSKHRKGLAILTAFMTMVVMTASPVMAFASEGSFEKDETVYVVTDAAGEATDVIVSDHLVNDEEADTIHDKTNLKDIENVKGEEKFEQDGSDLTWDAEGNDIYYQGKTSKEVPVQMFVTYTLDDEEIAGEKLKGKDGHLKIDIDYENSASIDGAEVPFLVMTGLVVKDECLTDIEVSSGKVIDDGDKQFVVTLAAPGVADNLGVIGDELTLSDHVTIEGEAKDFNVEDMMTIVTNSVFEDIDTSEFDGLDLDSQVNALDSGASQLVEGSKQLYEGIDLLDSKTDELQDGVGQLDNGAKQLQQGTKQFTQTISESMKELQEGVATLYGANDSVYQGLQSLHQGVKQLKESTGSSSQLQQALGGADQYIDGARDALTGENKGIAMAKGAKANADQAVADIKSMGESLAAEKEQLLADETLTDEQKAKIGALFESMEQQMGSAATAAGTASAMAEGSVQYQQGAADALSSGSSENPKAKELVSAASGGLNQVNAGVEQLDAAIGYNNENGTPVKGETLLYGSYAVNNGLAKINKKLGNNVKESSEMNQGIEALNNGASELAKGLSQLDEGTGTMVSGIGKLDKGSLELSKGMAKLYSEGIAKIVDLYNSDIKGLSNDLRSMVHAGKDYNTFTSLPSNMTGSVKFIYKTSICESEEE